MNSMNNKLISKKSIVISIISYKEKKNCNVFDFSSDPDPLISEVDPRIRIHIKMKRIPNTDSYPQFR